MNKPVERHKSDGDGAIRAAAIFGSAAWAHPAADAPAVVERSQLSPAARAAVEAGIPDGTKHGYRGDWKRFEMWAIAAGHCPLPCSAETLTEYATHLTKTPRPTTGRPYKPASIDRALAAIAVAHQAAEAPPPNQKGARLVLRGYERQLKESGDPRGKVRRAAAATPRVLRRLVAALDLTTPSGLRDAAALTTGFALAARSSEARALGWEDVVEVEQGLEFDLWRPKVDLEQPLGVPYGTYPSTCPVRALRAWRQCCVKRGHEPTGPIFVRVDRHGRINYPMQRHGLPIGDPSGRMTTEGIREIVTRAAARASLTGAPGEILPEGAPRWTGHALRRGYAQAAREARKDMLESSRHGGWADGSKAFAAYFDRAAVWDEEFNPLFGIGL